MCAETYPYNPFTMPWIVESPEHDEEVEDNTCDTLRITSDILKWEKLLDTDYRALKQRILTEILHEVAEEPT
jgi:hypothetical protein